MIQGNWGRGMHHDDWGWHWIPMTIMMVAFVALVIWLVTTALRRNASGPAAFGVSPPPHEHSGPHRSAEDILAERLAHGDIEVDDYHRRLEALHKTRPPKA